jgi:hypothetical protein
MKLLLSSATLLSLSSISGSKDKVLVGGGSATKLTTRSSAPLKQNSASSKLGGSGSCCASSIGPQVLFSRSLKSYPESLRDESSSQSAVIPNRNSAPNEQSEAISRTFSFPSDV